MCTVYGNLCKCLLSHDYSHSIYHIDISYRHIIIVCPCEDVLGDVLATPLSSQILEKGIKVGFHDDSSTQVSKELSQ